MADTKTVTTPVEIKDLLWNEVPDATEHQTAADLHNTLILAAFLRGQEEAKDRIKGNAYDGGWGS